MSRIIMLTLIGTLCLFLLLDILAIIGLESVFRKLKKGEAIQQINQDIQKINLDLNPKDTAIHLCRKLSLDDLKEGQINKESNTAEIRSARWQIAQTSHKMALCYKEKTWDCILNDMGLCTQKSLYAFAESLNISGRHLEMEFSDREKIMYRKVVDMYHRQADKEAVMRLADLAYPVFESTLNRLNNQVVSAQNRYK